MFSCVKAFAFGLLIINKCMRKKIVRREFRCSRVENLLCKWDKGSIPVMGTKDSTCPGATEPHVPLSAKSGAKRPYTAPDPAYHNQDPIQPKINKCNNVRKAEEIYLVEVHYR